MSFSETGRSFFVVRNAAPDTGESERLVFDPEGVLHPLLTRFARFAKGRLADASVRTYLSALCRYFTWLQLAHGRSRRWNSTPARVRSDVLEYLVAALGCHVREHRLGFMTVRLTRGRRSGISGFLSALRLFYAAMSAEGTYQSLNPVARHLPTLEGQDSDLDSTSAPEFPRMPLVSGCVAEPKTSLNRRRPGRLTDAYFVIVNERWTPQPVDDPRFPARIFAAGDQAAWRLREMLVTRLLFETGARIHEICALTLGDWLARGLRQEATSINKGSNQRRVKFVRWSAATAKLLRRYFDGDRVAADPTHRTLNGYLSHAKHHPQLLYSVPLFLTTRGRPLTARTFRDLYWRPACRAARIDANIHQTRHWYVTMAMRAIHEEGHRDLGLERRLEELIRYMAWRAGKSTLQAYEHYFEAIRHGEIQARLHRRLDRALKHPPKPLIRPGSLPPSQLDDPDWALLRRLGGDLS